MDLLYNIKRIITFIEFGATLEDILIKPLSEDERWGRDHSLKVVVLQLLHIFHQVSRLVQTRVNLEEHPLWAGLDVNARFFVQDVVCLCRGMYRGRRRLAPGDISSLVSNARENCTCGAEMDSALTTTWQVCLGQILLLDKCFHEEINVLYLSSVIKVLFDTAFISPVFCFLWLPMHFA